MYAAAFSQAAFWGWLCQLGHTTNWRLSRALVIGVNLITSLIENYLVRGLPWTALQARTPGRQRAQGVYPLQHSVGTGGFEKGFAQGVTLAADPSSELVPAGGTLGGDEEDCERKGAAASESRASPRSTARKREGRR